MDPRETISLICEACGEPTPKDIRRFGGVQHYTHVRVRDERGELLKTARRCRLVVSPDPLNDDHWSWPVPDGVTFYDAIQEVLDRSPEARWRDRFSAIEQARIHALMDRPRRAS